MGWAVRASTLGKEGLGGTLEKCYDLNGQEKKTREGQLEERRIIINREKIHSFSQKH